MYTEKEENVVYVLQRAIKTFKLRVTNTSVKKCLLSHPYYPSLKSICDVLKKWNVKHYPLKLTNDEIKLVEIPFIAHLKSSGGKLVFVYKIENDQVIYTSSKGEQIIEGFENFSQKLSGAVVLIEKEKNEGEKNYVQIRQTEIINKSLLPIAILSIVFLVIFTISYNHLNVPSTSFSHFWGLLFTKIIGLTASVFLVLHELKVQNTNNFKVIV